MGDDRRKEKTTISSQHVHEFLNNLNTKYQQRELEKTKNLDPEKHGFLKLMKEDTKRMMPIMASTSSTGSKKKKHKQIDASTSKQTYIASSLTADERALANLPTPQLVQVIDFVQ
jgi:hypothetical protein